MDFESVGGFNSQFRHWGLEDIDLGQRLMQAGIALDFCLDAWAEQGIHTLSAPEPRQTNNHRYLSPEPSQRRPAQLIYHPGFSRLGELLHRHYFSSSGRQPGLAVPESDQAFWQIIHLSPETEGL